MKHIYATLIVPLAILIPIAIGLFKGVYKNAPLKTIFFYLVFATVIYLLSRILGLHGINNLPLLHFYTIVEYLFILWYFRSSLNEEKASRVIGLLMVVFPVLSILDLLLIQDIFQFNSYPRPVAALIIIGLCMYYFFRYSGNENKKSWATIPFNWINTGLLIYFCSGLIYFAFLSIITKYASAATYYLFGTIHATLVLLMYLLFAIGFLKVKDER
ncbi:hypothetical protein [Pedobacter gandavensis]|uniref:hypothetical protein n=1 Tax=Pedobacter gandavensis TaxID=2679963 RepID=UPI00292CE040|nr:hypothetical protein [Pedobacter gandavensis]